MKLITNIILAALCMGSFQHIVAADVAVATQQLVGTGIAEFIPEGYDPQLTPSLILQAEPTPKGALPAGWEITPVFSMTDGKAAAEIALDGSISLYGGGEVTGPLLRNGKTIKLWNTDTGAYGVDGGCRLYQSHPWVMGVRNDGSAFGVIFDTSWKAELTTADSGITFRTEGEPFRVYVIDRESPQDVLKGLAELTGTMEMPPLWALGYHQCRFSYGSESKVRSIADNFRTRNIPCDVIWMDIDYMDGYRIFTFNPTNFPNPLALNNELHQKGFRAVYMIDPGAKVDPNYHVYKSGNENDVWVKRPDGTVYQGKVWPGYCAFPDFTRPETRTWWSGLYKDFLAKGIDGVWNDMNEPAVTDDDIPEEQRIGTMPYDTPHRGGGNLPAGSHLLYHNAYGRLMTEATREGVMAVYPDRRPFVLTRANLLGGHRYAATWTGDNWAGWDHLKLSVPMSLTLGLSGQPFSGPDIGGFLNNTEPEIWANWIGFGVFLPFVRGHACAGTNDKEPWAFGTAIENSSRIALERRYRLLPYIYTLFHDAHLTGIPVMQPVFFADPSDLSLRGEQQSFMLGENLMVIPAFAAESDVAMPQGIWETLSVVEGDRTDRYQATLKIKGGSIIPAGRVIQSTTEKMFEPLTLFACLDADGTAEGRLYCDAGEGWEFRDGDYAMLTFRAERSGNTITVKCTGKEGNRDVNGEIAAMRAEVIVDGRRYCGDGTLGDGVTIQMQDLFLVGSATPAGWSTDNAIAMDNDGPGLFSWTGELAEGGEFKFLPARSWDVSYTTQFAEPGNQEVASGQTYALHRRGENEGHDNKFTVPSTGTYIVSADLNDMTMTCTKVKIETTLNLYITGSACPCGWSYDNALPLERQSDGHYTITTTLSEGGNFRFLTMREWYPTYTSAEADVPVSTGTYKLVYHNSRPAGEPAFKATSFGTFHIDVDPEAMTMTVTPADERVFVVGSALNARDGVWDFSMTSEMAPTSTPHEFTWNGTLYAKTKKGDNTEFKFLKSTSSWDGYVSDSPSHQLVTDGGVYPIADSSVAPDHKFNVPADGTYSLRLNTATRTLYVSDGSGITTTWAHGISVRLAGNQLTVDTPSEQYIEIIDILGHIIEARNVLPGKATFNLKSGGTYIVTANRNVITKIVVPSALAQR